MESSVAVLAERRDAELKTLCIMTQKYLAASRGFRGWDW